MKTKHVGFRVDETTKEILETAKHVSGIPISEIVRKGVVSEATRIISMFRNVKHVSTTMSTHGGAS